MRLILHSGLWCAALLLALAIHGASAGPVSNGPVMADPPAWPTPNPDPNWYYYDLGPSDPVAYRPVTIAEIVADPFQFNGQLVRVRGAFSAGGGIMSDCPPRPASGTPIVEPGFMTANTPIALYDPSGRLGVMIWGKAGDSFGDQDALTVSDGDQLELRGILRAGYRGVACSPDRQMATAYLAIQRVDPQIPFARSAQDLGQRLTHAPQNSDAPQPPPLTGTEAGVGGGPD